MDFYGWPWFYAGGNEDPTLPGKHPELKFQSIVPDVLLQPHSAPIQLAFYDGTQFPSAYRRDIFVISSPGSSATRRLTARRADVPQASVTAEGSLLVADDLGNTIWREPGRYPAIGAALTSSSSDTHPTQAFTAVILSFTHKSS